MACGLLRKCGEAGEKHQKLAYLRNGSNTGLWFLRELSDGVRPEKTMELSYLLLSLLLESHWLDSAFHLNITQTQLPSSYGILKAPPALPDPGTSRGSFLIQHF